MPFASALLMRLVHGADVTIGRAHDRRALRRPSAAQTTGRRRVARARETSAHARTPERTRIGTSVVTVAPHPEWYELPASTPTSRRA